MPENKRVKVLFCVPTLAGGGEERIAIQLVNGFDRAQFEVVLAVGKLHGAFAGDVARDVRVVEIGAERSRFALRKLGGVIRAERPRAVMTFLGFNIAAGLIRKFFSSDVRFIARQGNPGSAFISEVKERSSLMAQVYRQAFSRAYPSLDKIICQCDMMLADLRDNFSLPAAKLSRIYNPVDVVRVGEAARASANLYHQSDINLVSVGRLEHQKAFDVMLKAFALTLEKHPSARLTIIGEGSQRASLEKLKSELKLHDTVRLIKFQANPYPYLANADVFVSSSRYEGLALVILEALACGTPVVATDCPSCIREVLVEGVNGWLAPPDSVEGFAAKVCFAIERRVQLSREIIKRDCLNRFDLPLVTRQHEDLILNC